LLARPQYGLAGFRAPLLVAGVLSILAAAGVALFVRESRQRTATSAAEGLRLSLLGEARRHPVLGRALIVTLLYTSAFAAAESTFGLRAQDRFGWGPRQLSYAFAAVAVTAALAQGFLTGRLTRRYGEAVMLAAGLAIISATLALQPLGAGMNRSIALLALTVFGQALALPNISALISRTTSPDRQGAMLGLNMSVGAASRAIGPVVGGALFSLAGPDAPLYAAAVAVAPAILLSWQAEEAARRLRRRETA
jgi:predicted MFS family arabinose efflux permease